MANYFQHSAAIVESQTIGEGTRVWAFAHILPGAVVGSDCNICDHVFIENDVVVGDRVTVKCGVQLWDGLRLEDDVFVGPNATFINDVFPRSKRYPKKFTQTIIREGASIGANATIMAGLTIGRNAMVGAGAVVIHDVPPNAIVTGNPARITGYVDSPRSIPTANAAEKVTPMAQRNSLAQGVTIYDLPQFVDMRGSLVVGEFDRNLPFQPKRFFTVFDVPGREVRGEHAHRRLHQFFVCLKGDCSLVVDDGVHREELRLSSPTVGVHVQPMVWGIQYKFSSDAVLLVLASDKYEADDYIRDYDEFRQLVELSRKEDDFNG
ncbi:MAG: WxcM-like domain-containing protein [Blastocatellia bacterium]